MTINIEELRRLAQEAMHPVTKGRWMRLFGERTVYDRMEDGCRGIPVVSTPVSPPHPFEAACLDFIAAANPATISKLLDRLEAAESARRDDYQNWMTALDRNAELLAKLEAAEKERDECNSRRLEAADHFAAQTALMKEKRDALRAEIEELHALIAAVKKQADAEFRIRVKKEEEYARLQVKIEAMERQKPVGTLHDDGCFVWRKTAPHESNYAGWKMVLYALPGAQTQGEEK